MAGPSLLKCHEKNWSDVLRDNLVIFGPTASGKSSLSLELARKNSGEIINMDSMQIYQGMDIATAKPTKKEREAIAHHLFDIVEPDEDFTTFNYKKLALNCIKEIRRRGNNPILVGGTGLYLSSLYYDFDFRQRNREKRMILEKLFKDKGIEALQEEAEKKYPKLLGEIDKNNPHRLIRLLETGTIQNKKKRSSLALKLIILEEDKDILNEKIRQRIDKMLKDGLLDEVDKVYRLYGDKEYLPAIRGIGYKEYFPYLRGEISLEEAKERHHISSRQYAKRQRTWGRNQYSDAVFIPAHLSLEEKIYKIEEQWR